MQAGEKNVSRSAPLAMRHCIIHLPLLRVRFDKNEQNQYTAIVLQCNIGRGWLPRNISLYPAR
ncbi:MAG TPA: hypothetical protein PKH67_03620, partial [Rhodocyclaceae bacterium]|nr:hypothetical protein [Rhodocyclaceae bacterium]